VLLKPEPLPDFNVIQMLVNQLRQPDVNFSGLSHHDRLHQPTYGATHRLPISEQEYDAQQQGNGADQITDCG
jgi:hypothetical protein